MLRAEELLRTCAAEEQLAAMKAEVERVTTRYESFCRDLDRVTEHYMVAGIGIRPNIQGSWLDLEDKRHTFSWAKYFATLAKELKRPFVYVEHFQNHDVKYHHAELTVTKRRYTEAL